MFFRDVDSRDVQPGDVHVHHPQDQVVRLCRGSSWASDCPNHRTNAERCIAQLQCDRDDAVIGSHA